MFSKVKRQLKGLVNYLDPNKIPTYYFDAKPNFGDNIGPFIISKVSGNKTLNIRELPLKPNYAYCTVGSLLHSLAKPNCHVWGSGFISDPADNIRRIKEKPLTVSALRGPISADFAKKMGWGYCEVFGDPGLLMPKYLELEGVNTSDTITLIPHYSFAKNHTVNPARFNVVYPWYPLEVVAKKINESKLVISSSLHGIILADAYRVPWIWWREENDIRKGGELKFLDFFASLSIHNPSSVTGKFYEQCILTDNLLDKANLSDSNKLSIVQAGLIESMPVFKTNAEIRKQK